MYGSYKSPFGYESGVNGWVDSYGVDHSGFSTQDELQYQTARAEREKQLAENLQRQGVTESSFPQYGTNFWGNSANNYGFGVRNIAQNAQNHPAKSMTPALGLLQQQSMTTENNSSNFGDKLKTWGDNFADATQALAVGYTTGATLGNFDEAMGASTAALSGNKNNYALGRDATRKLQNDLQQRHPYVYRGAEFVGAMTTPMHLVRGASKAKNAINAVTDTLNASAGYAENWKDFGENLVVNGVANGVGFKIEQLPIFRASARPLMQLGKKFLRQGINYSADKLRNMFYDNE